MAPSSMTAMRSPLPSSISDPSDTASSSPSSGSCSGSCSCSCSSSPSSTSPSSFALGSDFSPFAFLLCVLEQGPQRQTVLVHNQKSKNCTEGVFLIEEKVLWKDSSEEMTLRPCRSYEHTTNIRLGRFLLVVKQQKSFLLSKSKRN